ncbi:hypothetical protein ACFL38_02200 [Candidatus Omnitrophota bacterium]
MRVLKGILSESKEYYLDAKKKIEGKIADLPKGSVKERMIHGGKYYYLQYRKGSKIVHTYLGKGEPEELIKKISRRKALKDELKKINEALKIVSRSEGRKK